MLGGQFGPILLPKYLSHKFKTLIPSLEIPKVISIWECLGLTSFAFSHLCDAPVGNWNVFKIPKKS
jgi:hypothetical protein